MTEKRQIYDPNRPTWTDWNYIKDYIPAMPLENKQDIAPEYGYIFDKFRQKYGIYISIIPRVDVNIDDEESTVFRYIGKLIGLKSSSKIYKELTVTGTSYTILARKLIIIAADLVKTGEIIDGESYIKVNPETLWLNDKDYGEVKIVSNTIWNIN